MTSSKQQDLFPNGLKLVEKYLKEVFYSRLLSTSVTRCGNFMPFGLFFGHPWTLFSYVLFALGHFSGKFIFTVGDFGAKLIS